jgi:hypothetical protein
MKKCLLAVCAALFLLSCKKIAEPISDPGLSKTDPVYKYIKQLGFRDNEIKDNGKEYLVDGDMAFSKDLQPDFSIFDGPKPEQYGTANYVGYSIQPSVTVRIDPSMAGFTNEIIAALNLWNGVANCRLKFVLTGATNQQILITNQNLGAGLCGVAVFPSNGNPGFLVRINGGLTATLNVTQRVSLIAHELGHCIGFRHTNWQPAGEPVNAVDNGATITAMHILGTPTGGDPGSIMNGSTCGIAPAGLSPFDIVAMQYLYPANAPVAGAVPVLRYFTRNSTTSHFYSTNFAELGNGLNAGYIFEGIGFFAFPNQVPGSVPVYRYFRAASGNHFYTANFAELGGGAAGYRLEGIAFYAYPSQQPGTLPVFRYYSPSSIDHFYTKNPNELLTLGGYNLEGVAWFAY